MSVAGYFDRFLTLGSDEIATLGPELNVALVTDVVKASRLSVLYAPNDMWASLRHLEHLKSLLRCGYIGGVDAGGKSAGGERRVSLEVLDGIKHDFPVRAGWERVADWALNEIARIQSIVMARDEKGDGRGLSKL